MKLFKPKSIESKELVYLIKDFIACGLNANEYIEQHKILGQKINEERIKLEISDLIWTINPDGTLLAIYDKKDLSKDKIEKIQRESEEIMRMIVLRRIKHLI